ncbi:MAG: hypothetical protein ACI9SJ_002351 [Flavobacteriaceae bacterium]|jgi:hypothetical protein|uniref:hypothetical protein n=1 Tax=Candidatus Marifrigoribacter sp. Uisw_064 TaxID=3230970 RepID=UPI003AD862E7
MGDWFTALSNFEKVYWVIALIGSAIFIIVMIMTLIGGDVDDLGDVDMDVEGDLGIDFQFLSFKNLVGFFTIFGWSGVACISKGMSQGATIVISLTSGLIMMTLMATLFYYLSKLTSSGNLLLKNALNEIGEVYITLGANRSSIGKIQIKVQGSLRELDALSDESEDLKQGTVVKVMEVSTNGMLIVKKI